MADPKNIADLKSTLGLETTRLMALVGRALGLPGGAVSGSEPVDWDALLALADRHRVLTLLYSGLKVTPELAVPADVSARLVPRVHGIRRRSLILSQELARLYQLLSSQQIPMAAMKGPGLSAQAYGTDAARAMRDLDILVRPQDFRQAQAALESAGFVCEGSFSHLTRPLQDLHLRSTIHITFQHTTLGYLLEVHLRLMPASSLLPLSTETLLAEAVPVSLGGGEVPVLAMQHHFLFVAAHGAKHGWWRLLWLADFAAFQRLLPESASCLPGAADELGLRRVLNTARTLCHLCFGVPLSAPTGEASSKPGAPSLVAFGLRCLERGGPPVSYAEKWDELFHLLRLRPETAYRWETARLYWNLTPTDLGSLTQLASLPPLRRLPPSVLAGLAPALRPLLWASRRVPPHFRP